MKNFVHINQYLEELEKDIYKQPPDPQHTAWAKWVIRRFHKMFPECKSVLDVGCGEAFAQPMFERFGMSYAGICLGEDFFTAWENGRSVSLMDFNFIDYADNSFELVFARHALEHSPIPMLSLMEWHRVASRWLCLVVPNPDYWTYTGRNHYFVLNRQQMRWLLRRTGWKVEWKQYTKYEYRYFCTKRSRVGYEGWANNPLSADIYEDERDNA